MAAPISGAVSVSHPRTTGTSSPSSVSTATPRLTVFQTTVRSPRKVEFSSGNSPSASHTARAMKGR